MIIENLTRFLPACSLDKVPMPVMIQTLDEDSYVRFLDVKEASSNSLQHLQAKIRAIADKLFVCHFQSGSGGLDNLALINELRELSAVQ